MKKNLFLIIVSSFMLVSMTGCLSWFYGSNTKKTKTANTTQTVAKSQTPQVKTYGSEFGQIYIDNANDCTQLAAQLNAYMDANEEEMLNNARKLIKSGKSSDEAFDILFKMPDDMVAQQSDISGNCLINDDENDSYTNVSKRMSDFAFKFDELGSASTSSSSRSSSSSSSNSSSSSSSGKSSSESKCYSNSDCGSGVACNSGICATSAGGKCYSNSDCGSGVACNSGKCATAPDGRCYSNSDCGGGSCNSGKCANGAGGRCYSNSDCGNGVACNSGVCANAAGGKCYSNSDCGPGVACNSGKCATAPDGRCYSNSDCGGRSCNSGHCA